MIDDKKSADRSVPSSMEGGESWGIFKIFKDSKDASGSSKGKESGGSGSFKTKYIRIEQDPIPNR